MAYWTALEIANQTVGELGLESFQTFTGPTVNDKLARQMLALLNASGVELLLYYPWEQFAKDWAPTIVAGTDEYNLPADLNYFRDQTQWDRSNRWPLLGPKSAQEWAWLKGSFVAALPRIRYRIQQNKFKLFPTPASALDIHMEYVSTYWVKSDAAAEPDKDRVTLDSDVIYLNPWLIVKFLKFKFYELKGFPTAGVNADFMRVFDSLMGKDTGAEKLNLNPHMTTPYLGPWSIPDGNWQV